jgi:hypothetical protein
MTTTHQYQALDASAIPTVLACGDGSSLTLSVDSNGYVKYNGTTVAELKIWYIGTSAPFEIVLTGTDLFVGALFHDGTPSAGGLTWTPDGGGLKLYFHGPVEGSSSTWQLGSDTPPIRLQVKVKRPSSANSGACTSWT